MDVLDVFSSAASGITVAVLDKLQWMLEQPVYSAPETPLPSPRSVLPSIAVSVALTADESTPLPTATPSVIPAVFTIEQAARDTTGIVSSYWPLVIYLALTLFITILYGCIIEKEVEHPTFLDDLDIAISDPVFERFARVTAGIRRVWSRARVGRGKPEVSPEDEEDPMYIAAGQTPSPQAQSTVEGTPVDESYVNDNQHALFHHNADVDFEDDPMYIAATQPPPKQAYYMLMGTPVEGQQPKGIDEEKLQSIVDIFNTQFGRLKKAGQESLDYRNHFKDNCNWNTAPPTRGGGMSTVEAHTTQCLNLLEPHIYDLPPELATFYRSVARRTLDALKYRVLLADKIAKCDEAESGLAGSRLRVQRLGKEKHDMEKEIEKRVDGGVKATLNQKMVEHTRYCEALWEKAMENKNHEMQKEIEMRVESSIKAAMSEQSAAHSKEGARLMAQHTEEKQDMEKEIEMIKASHVEVVAEHDEEVCKLKETIATLKAAARMPPPPTLMPISTAAPLPVIDEAPTEPPTPAASPASTSSPKRNNGQAPTPTLHPASAVVEHDQLPVGPPQQSQAHAEVSTPSTILQQAPVKSSPPPSSPDIRIDLTTFLNITRLVTDAHTGLVEVPEDYEEDEEDAENPVVTECEIIHSGSPCTLNSHKQHLFKQLEPYLKGLHQHKGKEKNTHAADLIEDWASITMDGAYYQMLHKNKKRPTTFEMSPIATIADQPPTEAGLPSPQRPNGIDYPTLLAIANVVINSHDRLLEASKQCMNENDELQDNVWGIGRDGQPCTVDIYKSDLLQKLEPHLQTIDAGIARFIKTWAGLIMDGPLYKVLYKNKKERSKTGLEKQVKNFVSKMNLPPSALAGPATSSMPLQSKQIAKLLSRPLNVVTTPAAAGITATLAPTQNTPNHAVPHRAPFALSGAAAQFNPLLISSGPVNPGMPPVSTSLPVTPFAPQASRRVHPFDQMPPSSGDGCTATFAQPQDRPAPESAPLHMLLRSEGDETMATRPQSPEELEASSDKGKSKTVCKLPPAPTMQRKHGEAEEHEQEQAQGSLRPETAPFEPAAAVDAGPGTEQSMAEAALFAHAAASTTSSSVEQRAAEAASFGPPAAAEAGPGAEQSMAEEALFAGPAAAPIGSRIEQRMADAAPFVPAVRVSLAPIIEQGTAEAALPSTTAAAPKPLSKKMKDSMWAS